MPDRAAHRSGLSWLLHRCVPPSPSWCRSLGDTHRSSLSALLHRPVPPSTSRGDLPTPRSMVSRLSGAHRGVLHRSPTCPVADRPVLLRRGAQLTVAACPAAAPPCPASAGLRSSLSSCCTAVFRQRRSPGGTLHGQVLVRSPSWRPGLNPFTVPEDCTEQPEFILTHPLRCNPWTGSPGRRGRSVGNLANRQFAACWLLWLQLAITPPAPLAPFPAE